MTENNVFDIYDFTSKVLHWSVRTEEDREPVYSAFLNFTDRDSYLEWRKQWRALYAQLSQDIRTARKEWRAEGQEHDPARHNALFRNRALARAMLGLRKASKRKAQVLYE